MHFSNLSNLDRTDINVPNAWMWVSPTAGNPTPQLLAIYIELWLLSGAEPGLIGGRGHMKKLNIYLIF